VFDESQEGSENLTREPAPLTPSTTLSAPSTPATPPLVVDPAAQVPSPSTVVAADKETKANFKGSTLKSGRGGKITCPY